MIDSLIFHLEKKLKDCLTYINIRISVSIYVSYEKINPSSKKKSSLNLFIPVVLFDQLVPLSDFCHDLS